MLRVDVVTAKSPQLGVTVNVIGQVPTFRESVSKFTVLQPVSVPVEQLPYVIPVTIDEDVGAYELILQFVSVESVVQSLIVIVCVPVPFAKESVFDVRVAGGDTLKVSHNEQRFQKLELMYEYGETNGRKFLKYLHVPRELLVC